MLVELCIAELWGAALLNLSAFSGLIFVFQFKLNNFLYHYLHEKCRAKIVPDQSTVVLAV